MAKPSDNSALGLNAGLAATLIWGTYPLWYSPLAHISTLELLANRIVWSLVIMVPLLLLVFKKGRLLRQALADRNTLGVIFGCSLILAGWWFTYMWCIINGRVLEAGLGYYLGPIFTVGMGVVLLKERIDRISALAVAISFAGIAYYAFQTQGDLPYFGIMLGLFYSGYTIVKRSCSKIDQQVSVTGEIIFLMPWAIGLFSYAAILGTLQTGVSTTPLDNVLLLMLGVINVLPMWWYSLAARNLPAVAMSFIQYISPTCNFLLAAFYFGEEVTQDGLVMFLLVWTGIILYSCNLHFQARRTQSATS